MNVKPRDKVLRKPICTWLSESDYRAFETVATSNRVTVAAYLRSIVIDAIQEDMDALAHKMERVSACR